MFRTALFVAAGLALGLALGLAPGGVAAAQPADPVAAKARGQEMISRVWAVSAFSADAWEKGPLVRHRRTGLVCRFNGDAANSVDVYEGEKFSMVGCTIREGATTIQTYGNPPAGGVDQIAITAEAALRKAYAELTPYTGPGVDPPTAGMPPIAVSRFTGEKDGKRWYIQLASMDMGRWSFVQRAVGPVETAADTDRLASASLVGQARDAGYTVQASAGAPGP